MSKYIGAIDQGTTSTRFILFDHESNKIASQILFISAVFKSKFI